MSVKQLESAVAALPPGERRRFIHWLDDHRHELVDEADDFALTAKQKAELQRRKEAFTARSHQWPGNGRGHLEKIHQHLHARRAQRRLPAAVADIIAAAEWYDDQRAGLGDEFVAEVDSVIRLH